MIASIFLQLSIQYQFSTIDIEPIIDLQRVRANDRNSRKISVYVKDWATTDALRICNYSASGVVPARDIAGGIGCIYKRRASSLPSDIDKAMREASNGRTVTDTDSYAFSFYNLTPTRGWPRQDNPLWKKLYWQVSLAQHWYSQAVAFPVRRLTTGTLLRLK